MQATEQRRSIDVRRDDCVLFAGEPYSVLSVAWSRKPASLGRKVLIVASNGKEKREVILGQDDPVDVFVHPQRCREYGLCRKGHDARQEVHQHAFVGDCNPRPLMPYEEGPWLPGGYPLLN